MKRLPVPNRNQDIRRDHDYVGLRRLWLWAVGGLVLAGGFMFASWQHYLTVRYGYDYEKTRLERRELEAAQLRLRADWERAVALPNLESKALSDGLQPLSSGQIEALANNLKAGARRTAPTRPKKAANR